jgi:hypothetical protein
MTRRDAISETSAQHWSNGPDRNVCFVGHLEALQR